jgi:hypothetical protein
VINNSDFEGNTPKESVIAGILALYQIKSNIVASARIRWNEELKKTLSDYYSDSLNASAYCNDFVKDKNNVEKEDKYMTALSKYNALSNHVRMQLNSGESEHNRIEIIMDKIDRLLDDDSIKEIDIRVVEIDLKEIVALSKIIFKKEWKKAKSLWKI